MISVLEGLLRGCSAFVLEVKFKDALRRTIQSWRLYSYRPKGREWVLVRDLTKRWTRGGYSAGILLYPWRMTAFYRAALENRVTRSRWAFLQVTYSSVRHLIVGSLSMARVRLDGEVLPSGVKAMSVACSSTDGEAGQGAGAVPQEGATRTSSGLTPSPGSRLSLLVEACELAKRSSQKPK